MPRQLSPALIREKNSLESTAPWLITLDITLPDATQLFLVKNNENIEFQGRTYTAANFDLDGITEDGKGAIPQVQLKVADQLRALEAHMQGQGGMLGSTVIMRVIDYNYLAENYADLEMALEVIASSGKGGNITFTLGIPSPFRKRFPLLRARGEFCNWVRWYRGAECGYNGALGPCNGTLEACRLRNNSRRFGGQPGLGKGGLRLA